MKYDPPTIFLFGKTVKGQAESPHSYQWVVTRWPLTALLSHALPIEVDRTLPFYWRVVISWNHHAQMGYGQADTLEKAVRDTSKAAFECFRDLQWWLQNTPLQEGSPGKGAWDRILNDDGPVPPVSENGNT